MTDTHGSIVKEIAEQIAEGRLEVLINGSLFRSIHGVQSKLELVHTPNALVSLSRWDHLSAPAGLLGTVQEVSEVHAGLRSLGEDGVDLLYGSRDVPSLSELDSQRYTHGAARSIRHESTSNAALRAIAQAAANTDGQSAAAMSEIVCQTIAEVPGLLPAVIERLEHDVDAVRLINNLAANCMRSAQLFVNVPGSLKALKGSTKKFKLHSFGVISHLSRCPEASRALIAHGFVHEILYPALDLCDDPLPVEQEATIARGTLALANLTQPSAVCHASALGLCQDSPTFTPSNKVALETIVKVLDHAVRGERLATITWLPPAVLYGLRNMTYNSSNKIILLECGLAPILATVLDHWVPETGIATLELTIESVTNLANECECFQQLWDAGVVRVLQHLEDRLQALPPTADGLTRDFITNLTQQVRQLVEVLLERHVALCMGQHRRLGGRSSIASLDDAVVYKILEFAFGMSNGGKGPYNL